MKTITVDGKEYKLEFGFDAVEVGDLVQKMFEVKSGLYVARSAQAGNNIAVAMEQAKCLLQFLRFACLLFMPDA